MLATTFSFAVYLIFKWNKYFVWFVAALTKSDNQNNYEELLYMAVLSFYKD